jgi:hypothetical protein
MPRTATHTSLAHGCHARAGISPAAQRPVLETGISCTLPPGFLNADRFFCALRPVPCALHSAASVTNSTVSVANPDVSVTNTAESQLTSFQLSAPGGPQVAGTNTPGFIHLTKT